jgi:hypothetical protein
MAEIRPAATVILLRDAPDGLHVLLLRRNSALGFAAGQWVFPGGGVDAGEIERTGDALAAAYVELEVDGQTLWGVGIDGDISTASLKAIVSAVNRSVRARATV